MRMGAQFEPGWVKLCAPVLVLLLPMLGGADIISTFGNPGSPAFVSVNLAPDSTDDSTYLLIPEWANVLAAELNFSVSGQTGQFNLSIGDGAVNWTWTNETTDGTLGTQNGFSTKAKQAQVQIVFANQSQGFNDSLSFYLPQGAVVDTFELELEGPAPQFLNITADKIEDASENRSEIDFILRIEAGQGKFNRTLMRPVIQGVPLGSDLSDVILGLYSHGRFGGGCTQSEMMEVFKPDSQWTENTLPPYDNDFWDNGPVLKKFPVMLLPVGPSWNNLADQNITDEYQMIINGSENRGMGFRIVDGNYDSYCGLNLTSSEGQMEQRPYMQIYYNLTPLNLRLDINNDGVADWFGPSELDQATSPTTVSGLEAVVTGAAASNSIDHVDALGHQFVEIKLNFTVDRTAYFNITSLSVGYHLPQSLGQRSGPTDLSNLLDTLVETWDEGDNHDVTVPLEVFSEGPSSINFTSIYIEYDLNSGLSLVVSNLTFIRTSGSVSSALIGGEVVAGGDGITISGQVHIKGDENWYPPVDEVQVTLMVNGSQVGLQFTQEEGLFQFEYEIPEETDLEGQDFRIMIENVFGGPLDRGGFLLNRTLRLDSNHPTITDFSASPYFQYLSEVPVQWTVLEEIMTNSSTLHYEAYYDSDRILNGSQEVSTPLGDTEYEYEAMIDLKGNLIYDLANRHRYHFRFWVEAKDLAGNDAANGGDSNNPHTSRSLLYELPELTLQDLKDPDGLALGDTMHLDILVMNMGGVIESGFEVILLVNEIQVDQIRINDLGFHQNVSMTLDWFGNETGFHNVRVIVDADEEIDEADEGNNADSILVNFRSLEGSSLNFSPLFVSIVSVQVFLLAVGVVYMIRHKSSKYSTNYSLEAAYQSVQTQPGTDWQTQLTQEYVTGNRGADASMDRYTSLVEMHRNAPIKVGGRSNRGWDDLDEL